MPLSPAMRRVQSARAALLLEEPFFGVLALQLMLLEDPSCKTAWTNGRDLGFSPAFVLSLSHDALKGLIAHEVMHCACGHPWRRGSRDPRKWNVAADHAINHVLTDAGFDLPAGALQDAQFKGKYSEWIYDRLPESQQPQPGQQGQPGQGSQGKQQGQPGADPSQYGEVRDALDDADAPTDADWQQVTQQAARAAQGKLPASLRRDVAQLAQPRVDWRSLLRRYIQETAKADYAWSRPNVRYLCAGLYLPSLHSEAMGRIAVAIDTSGSIDSVLLQQFGSELTAIANELQPAAVDVIYCDARVHRVDTFERGDSITLQAVGGGGTDFRPVFDHIDRSDDAPAVAIYLTDMYGTFPAAAPGYPVIWASYSDVDVAPFGDVVPCGQ